MSGVLVLMGSGETSPTMTKTHRELVAEKKTKRAVLLDTPAGFQENVSIVSAKAVEYFKESVNLTVDVASLRRASLEKSDPLAFASTIAALNNADWIFAGPGSPTFAVRQWNDTVVAETLASTVRDGGVVIMASAAACTSGRRCVPVYEIYKCGEDPLWAEGIELLRALGFPNVTVIPHFDNTEGTNHDTRFCYLGEPRLLALESMLESDEFIIGIDEHTALVLDIGNRTARVTGNGTVTVRRGGVATVFATGASCAIDALFEQSGAVAPAATDSAESSAESSVLSTDAAGLDPLEVEVRASSEQFDAAVASRDALAATEALLKLDGALAEWGRDPTTSPERSAALRNGASLRQTLIVRLGEFATSGLADPRAVRAPLVDLILQLRASARADKRWSDSDAIRDGLTAAGVEVRDTPSGVEWELR